MQLCQLKAEGVARLSSEIEWPTNVCQADIKIFRQVNACKYGFLELYPREWGLPSIHANLDLMCM